MANPDYGAQKVLAKPNHFFDDDQKEITFEFLKLIGWKYDEDTKTWWKKGIKTKDNEWCFASECQRRTRSKIVKRIPYSITMGRKIDNMKRQGMSPRRIATVLEVGISSVYRWTYLYNKYLTERDNEVR